MSRIGLRLALALALAASSAQAGDVSVQLDSGTGFSVRNAPGTIERLRVDEATGNVSRNGALFVHTAGTNGLFVGPGAGNPASSAQRNTAFGANAFGAGTTGFDNSAFGASALQATTMGSYNSAVGARALSANTSGWRNSAFGQEALRSNTTGRFNTALGVRTLELNTTGNYNLAAGVSALPFNTTGEGNVALGIGALTQNSSGSRNIAIGWSAGQLQSTGSNNIYIDNNGMPAENGQIRIGRSGIHTQAHIVGIFGSTISGGEPVVVNASGTLGTTPSSARFKQDVRDMGDASDLLMRLRPVTFRYREEAVGNDDARVMQYGMIAEEVAAVAPELVVLDAEGRPYSVKYRELPALLVAEAQKQRSAAADQERRLAEQSALIAAQQQEIASLASRLAQLEAARAGTDVAAAR